MVLSIFLQRFKRNKWSRHFEKKNLLNLQDSEGNYCKVVQMIIPENTWHEKIKRNSIQFIASGTQSIVHTVQSQLECYSSL